MANTLTDIKVIANGDEYNFGGGMREVHGKITHVDETITLEEGWKIVKYYLYLRGTGLDQSRVSLKCETGGICPDLAGGYRDYVMNSTVDTSSREKTTRGCCLNWDAKNLILRRDTGTVREVILEYWVYY